MNFPIFYDRNYVLESSFIGSWPLALEFFELAAIWTWRMKDRNKQWKRKKKREKRIEWTSNYKRFFGPMNNEQ